MDAVQRPTPQMPSRKLKLGFMPNGPREDVYASSNSSWKSNQGGSVIHNRVFAFRTHPIPPEPCAPFFTKFTPLYSSTPLQLPYLLDTFNATRTMLMEHSNRLLTTQEPASLLGLKAKTLENFRWRGIGPNYVKLGKSVRYRFTDVQDFIIRSLHQIDPHE